MPVKNPRINVVLEKPLYSTMMRFFLAAAIVLAAVPAFAGKVEFVKQHTYRAGGMDSKVSCRAIALMEVKRALLEQLGTYLASETEVRNYKMTKDQVTRLSAGRICVLIRDVASIRTGAYPENAEVISGRPEDEHSRRRAERDWQATQRENERARRSYECRQMLDYLQQLRPESDEYKTQHDQYQRECSAAKGAPASAHGKGGTSKTPVKKERKKAEMDRIMENANNGTVF